MYSDELQQELRGVRHLLGKSITREKHQSIFNFPLHDESHKLEEYIDAVYDSLDCAAKINIHFGFVLQHKLTGKLRYYYAGANEPVFRQPVFVSETSHVSFLKERLEGEDYFAHILQARPDSNWQYHCVTNVTIRATLVRDKPLGCRSNQTPEWMRVHKGIFTHERDSRTGETFKDNLCLFRGLERHVDGAQTARDMFNTFIADQGTDPRYFRGVKMADMGHVERLFEVNIVIYSAEKVNEKVRGELLRRSTGQNATTATFIRHDRHMCYVPNPKKVLKDYTCSSCHATFTSPSKLARHEVICSDRIKQKYPGGPYVLPQLCFEQLAEEGIVVPKHLRLFPFVAVFDFESMCRPSDDLQDTDTTSFLGKHIPISVSISSNLLQEPIFLCNTNPEALIVEFVDTLERIGQQSESIMSKRLEPAIQQLEGRLAGIEAELRKRQGTSDTQQIDGDDESTDEVPTDAEFLHMFVHGEDPESDTESLSDFIEGEAPRSAGDDLDADFVEPITRDFSMETEKTLKMEKRKLLQLRATLRDYISILPVFGFNSAKYDLNLIKQYLIPYLTKTREAEVRVIKNANSYVSFQCLNFKFLDIMKFLGGATSLESFLKAYQVEETKGFFSYEWFDHPDKLKETSLPPYDAFYSELKRVNPLGAEFDKFTAFLGQGMSEKEALAKLHLKTVPLSGQDHCASLQALWQEQQMQTMQDFLHGLKDVVPTLLALQRMVRVLSRERNRLSQDWQHTPELCQSDASPVSQLLHLHIHREGQGPR